MLRWLAGVFTRARANLNLSPWERAVLKLIGGTLVAALVAAVLAAGQAMVGVPVGEINWPLVLQAAGGAFVAAVWAAISKYYKAHQDSPLESSWSPAVPAAPAAPAAPAGSAASLADASAPAAGQ